MGRNTKTKKKFTTYSCGLCDKLDNVNMVCCDECNVWHHFKCVGVKKKDLEDTWKCPACSKKDAENKRAESRDNRTPSHKSIDQSSTSHQSRASRDKRPPSQSSDKRPTSQSRDKRPTSQSSDKRTTSRSSDKRPTSRSSDKRPSSRHSRDKCSPSRHSSDKRPSSRHSRDNRSISRHTSHRGNASRSQASGLISSKFVWSPSRSYVGSFHTRSEVSSSAEKERLMKIEMQRIDEERRLKVERDQEYLDQKYRILREEVRSPDNKSIDRKKYTEGWVDFHMQSTARSDRSKTPSESKSVKSFSKKLDKIQFDTTSLTEPRAKFKQQEDCEICDICHKPDIQKSLVNCSLCIVRGHHRCMETMLLDQEVCWICPTCKTPVAHQKKYEEKYDDKESIRVKATGTETSDLKVQRCDICGKHDIKQPFRACDICDKNFHFACMVLVQDDNKVILICTKCKGPEVKQPTDDPRVQRRQNVGEPKVKIESKMNVGAQAFDVRDPDHGSFTNPNVLSNIGARQEHNPNLTSLQIASRHVITKDLPYFNGKPEDWPIFISRFQNSTETCGFSNAENLDRLQKCIKGNAFEAVRSRLNIPEAVPGIIETLRLLYGRPELIVNSLLKKIREQPPPKADKLNTLVDFALGVKNISATMEQADLTEYLTNPSLVSELVDKLPTNTKVEWAKYKSTFHGRTITLTMLGDWLYRLAEVISTVTEPTPPKEKTSDKDESNKFKSNRTNVHQNYKAGTKPKDQNSFCINYTKSDEGCKICKKTCRSVEECLVFKSYNPEQRWKAMVEAKICRKCLRRHGGFCKLAKSCDVNGCTCKHHRLLHDPVKHSSFTKEKTNQNSELALVPHNVHINSLPNVFYRIVPVMLYNRDRVVKALAYLDEGSDLTLIERQLAAELNLFGIPERLCLLWTAKVHRFEDKSAIVNLEISGQNEFTQRFKLLEVRTVEDLALPEQTINSQLLVQEHPYLKGIPLIEYCGTPRIMIGLANARLCTQLEKLEGGEFEPIASRSRIGWSLHGPNREPSANSKQVSHRILVCQKHKDDEIYHKLVKEHFTVENFGVQANNNLNAGSKEDERAVKLLQSFTKRVPKGFETGLLFKNDFTELPDSYEMAKRRLICLEKQKPSKIQAIDDKINDYIAKGYVSKLEQHEINVNNQRVWYLPIFTVVYPKKPNKIRLVFDAAAEVNGISLNKILLKGPDQVSSLVDILRRFREKRIAVNGDIVEMFHQVKIRDEDRHLQRFLWRNGDDSKEPEIYVLNVMTFGATCSPSSAQFVKNTNAEEFIDKYPQAVRSIIENHYVDDMMDGEDTEEKAIQLVNEVKEIHRHGGFEITKFISNSRKVMEALGSKCGNENKSLDVDSALEIERVLGMYWNTELDCFTFSLRYMKIHQDVVNGKRYPTKRELLKTLMSIFDPLGLLSQYLIHLKILLQEVWRSEMSWDDQLLTENMKRSWDDWFDKLPKVEKIQIPRQYSLKLSPGIPTSIELHTFVDGSEEAFSAAVYLRIEDEEGVDCVLVGSKARVAPLKYMSIPRKELQSAVLGSRMAINIIRGQRFKITRKIFWTDSTTVLSWLKTDHRKYHQFVAHRIGEILENTESIDWRWIPSKQNVADEATKSTNLPNLDINSRWYQGPNFLRQAESEWPRPKNEIEPNVTEEMKVHCLHSRFVMQGLIKAERFSNWNRMVRALAYVIRYVRILKAKSKHESKNWRHLTQDELIHSRNLIFRQAQFENYPDEMVTLERNNHLPEAKIKRIPKTSSLINVLPHLDEFGILRARSRIGSNVNLPDELKKPIILPKDNKITRLLVGCYHRIYHHRNQETVINEIRQRFYIPRIRVVLRSVRTKDCQQCKNRDAKPLVPEMGDLPAARLALGIRPFSYIGIDYFGPISVVCGRTHRKRWGVLITCLTIRAIHIEIAHSLDTKSCIMCLRNFMNRRGRPVEIYSDCGTNMKGADNELQNLVSQIDVEEFATNFTSCYTKWCFNPPASASMGGSWERLIRSVKTCLYDIMPTRTPKDDVLQSLLLEVENVVNSRPLTFVPLEYEEDEALTPNHFLIGTSNGLKAPFDVEIDGPYLQSSWKEIQRLTELFWKRFVKEYVPTLLERTKWHYSVNPVQPGDIVVIYDDDNPRNTYPKAKVLQTVIGSNDQVRRVQVQKGDKNKTILWRPASRLAKLDVLKEPVIGSLAVNPGNSKTGGSVTVGNNSEELNTTQLYEIGLSDESVNPIPGNKRKHK